MKKIDSLVEKIFSVYESDLSKSLDSLDFVKLRDNISEKEVKFQIGNFLNSVIVNSNSSCDLYSILESTIDTNNLDLLTNILNYSHYNSVDQMTKFTKRDYLNSNLENLISKVDSNEITQFSLVMCDLDNFKHLNDNFGHYTGDQVLEKFGEIALNNLRGVDSIIKTGVVNENFMNYDNKTFRYGGEEFLFLLPETSVQQAVSICDRVRMNVQSGIKIMATSGQNAYKAVFNKDLVGNELVMKREVTASFGVSNYPNICSGHDCLIGSVDAALYRAKHSGKNKVEVATCNR